MTRVIRSPQRADGKVYEGYGTGKSYTAARELIVPNPENARVLTTPESRANIEQFKKIFRARGWDGNCPILGWYIDDTYTLSDGSQPFLGKFPDNRPRFLQYDAHCRLVAADELVPEGIVLGPFPLAAMSPGATAVERLGISLRYAGADVSPLDAADQIIKMQGHLWDNARIATYIGRDVGWIERCLTVRGAPEPIRAAVEGKKVSASTAAKLVNEERNPTQVFAAAEAHAKARGSERVRPRDVRAVSPAKPSTLPLEAPRPAGSRFLAALIEISNHELSKDMDWDALAAMDFRAAYDALIMLAKEAAGPCGVKAAA